MRECWPDGELRAYVDRELPADGLARLGAHLEACETCRMRCLLLEKRAERVMDLVGSLEEPAAVAARPPRPIPLPRRGSDRWMAAALAVAAAWTALVLLRPKRVEAPESPASPAPSMAATPAPPARIEMPSPAAAAPPIRRLTPAGARRPQVPAAAPRATLAGFVALDDEPIDAGVVMRVALADGRMQADVLYSPDGRPRAIRILNGPAAK